MSNPDDAAWDSGWDEHRQRQLERWAKLSFAEKLDWLEEADQIVRNLQISREQARQSPQGAAIPKDP